MLHVLPDPGSDLTPPLRSFHMVAAIVLFDVRRDSSLRTQDKDIHSTSATSRANAEDCTPSDDSMEAFSTHPSESQNSLKSSLRSRSTSRERNNPRQAPDGDNQNTFQRSAEIMCKSLRIDGVAFVDLAVDTFGGLIPVEANTEESSMASETSQEEVSRSECKPCSSLGCAESVTSGPVVPEVHKPAKMLAEVFIRRLVK